MEGQAGVCALEVMGKGSRLKEQLKQRLRGLRGMEGGTWDESRPGPSSAWGLSPPLSSS